MLVSSEGSDWVDAKAFIGRSSVCVTPADGVGVSVRCVFSRESDCFTHDVGCITLGEQQWLIRGRFLRRLAASSGPVAAIYLFNYYMPRIIAGSSRKKRQAHTLHERYKDIEFQ